MIENIGCLWMMTSFRRERFGNRARIREISSMREGDHKTVEAFLRNRPPACRGPAKSRRLTAEGVSAPLRVDRGNLNGCRTLSFVRDQQLSRFALIRRLGAEFLRENLMTMSESTSAINQLNIRLFNVIALSVIHLFGHSATASH